MATGDLGAAAANRVELGTDGGMAVFCDRRQAAEALSEVLRNALVHSPSEQKVSLAVVDVQPDRVRFEIADRGPGIPEYVLDIERDGLGLPWSLGGTPARTPGLGMMMASMIVARHGGHLGVMSEPGRGSEVFLTFPTCDDNCMASVR